MYNFVFELVYVYTRGVARRMNLSFAQNVIAISLACSDRTGDTRIQSDPEVSMATEGRDTE